MLELTLTTESSRTVMRRGLPPGTEIAQMFMLSQPSLFEVKATSLPSGDQVGYWSFQLCRVNWRGWPPATDFIQMSRFPLRVEVKASHLPSGDHAELLSTLP